MWGGGAGIKGRGAAKDLESNGLGGSTTCFKPTHRNRRPGFPEFLRAPTQNLPPPAQSGREGAGGGAWSPHLWELALGGSSDPAQRVQKSFTLDPGSSLFPGPELLRLSDLKTKNKKQ